MLGIPVPKVLAWNRDPANPVGSEYVLMQEAAGSQLSELWDLMDLPAKLQVVEDIVSIEKKFLAVPPTQ